MTHCLIVDDSKVVRTFSRRIIEKFSFEISEAEDGQKAIEACEVRMPDLILLDWYMPVMSGIEFLRHLRQKMAGGDKPVVIFCTTENEHSHIMEGMEAGANEYIMKPFDDEIVQAKLEQLGILNNTAN